MLYNIGGEGSTNSVYWLELLSEKPKWFSMKTVGEVSFCDHFDSAATVVKNKIVYFGSVKESIAYVLKQEEGGSSELKIEKRIVDTSYMCMRGDDDSSFCTFQKKVYFFPVDSLLFGCESRHFLQLQWLKTIINLI